MSLTREKIEDLRHILGGRGFSTREFLLLNEALDQALDQGWRPIEEAPKDGTVILGAFTDKTGANCGQHVIWWDPQFEWGCDYSAEPNEDGAFPEQCRGAWVDGGIDTDENPEEFFPTHFRPLPPPPGAML